MSITLPDLPYAKSALEPYISKQTISLHYGKHHQGYVKKLNKAIAGTPLDDASLEKIIVETDGDGARQGVFNNAAQVWNHSFYWNSMAPNGGGKPKGAVADAITTAFGDLAGFKAAFASAGAAQFGSGWAWLILKDSKLVITATGNAETPLTDPTATPLLTMDVWEHAYYLDYKNKRGAYIDAFLDNLINWDFVAKNMSER